MSVKLSRIIQAIEAVAPKSLAEDWDNVGLQVGSRQQPIHRILLTLDVTDRVIEEAVEKKADLILSHHPFIFKGLKTLSCDSEKGKAVERLIKNDIAVYVAHTNLDAAAGGINDYLAKRLELEQVKVLEMSPPTMYYKVVVYVPKECVEEMVQVMGKNGAGAIGHYDFCTFRTPGTGTFRPLEGAQPFVGTVNHIQSVAEERVEAIILASDLKNLIAQLKKNHPYEEMAYDVIPLENGQLLVETGLGRIGVLKEPMKAMDFMAWLKEKLGLETLRGAGNWPESVRRVAICSGTGTDLIGLAKAKRADVFITGDMKYHDGQRAFEQHLWVLDAGHYGTEKWVTDCFSTILKEALGDDCPSLSDAEACEDFLTTY